MIYCLDTDILIEYFRGSEAIKRKTESPTARIGGEIYAALRREGKLINDADILIASIVKAHDAVLVTNNEEHFSRIEGLRIENWLRS